MMKIFLCSIFCLTLATFLSCGEAIDSKKSIRTYSLTRYDNGARKSIIFYDTVENRAIQEQYFYYDNAKEYIHCFEVDGKRDGKYQEYSRDGKIKYEGFALGDEFRGEFYAYHENEQVKHYYVYNSEGKIGYYVDYDSIGNVLESDGSIICQVSVNESKIDTLVKKQSVFSLYAGCPPDKRCNSLVYLFKENSLLSNDTLAKVDGRYRYKIENDFGALKLLFKQEVFDKDNTLELSDSLELKFYRKAKGQNEK